MRNTNLTKLLKLPKFPKLSNILNHPSQTSVTLVTPRSDVTLLLCSDAECFELIKAMREEGKTLQEIADALGYKDRSTIGKILKRNS